MRRCSKCKETKPLDDFGNDKKGRLGKSYRCKECARKASSAHHYANRDHHNAVQRAWHHANKTKANADSRAYRAAHRDELLAKQKLWRDKNKSTQKERDRAKYLKRRTAVLKRCKEYASENREKTSTYRKDYRQKNKKRIRQQIQAWYNTKRKTDPSFRVLCALRRRITHAIKGNNKSDRTVKLLGCTVVDFIAHLEGLFTAGMTWDNYGKWHIDHIRPCSFYDFSDPEQQRACFHYTNMQPLWSEANQRKGKHLNLEYRDLDSSNIH